MKLPALILSFTIFALIFQCGYAQNNRDFRNRRNSPFLYTSRTANNSLYNLKIARLKYEGGGDWYANPTSLPNLIDFINKQANIKIQPQEEVVEAGGSQIFQYPYVYMTGHGNFTFTDAQAKNLRNYLIAGGFLHIDDNYGLEKNGFTRREMKKVFPELEFVALPFDHEIYKEHFTFEKGLPKIHEHDNKPPQGLALIYQGRVVVYYTVETDLGDGWEDIEVHSDPEALRQKALQMGMNIVLWAINH